MTGIPLHRRLGIFLAFLIFPVMAHAAAGQMVRNVVDAVIDQFRIVWVIIAVLSVVIAGFSLMLSAREEQLTKTRSTIIAVSIGVALTTILLSLGSTAIGWLYTGTSSTSTTNYITILDGTGADSIGSEAEGIGRWITSMAAVIGVVIIIITALRAFMSFGADESAHVNVRKSVLHVVFGLIIIGGAKLIREAFFAPTFTSENLSGSGSAFQETADFTSISAVGNPDPLMGIIRDKFLIVLGIIATIAVAILIYAGIRMVASFGNEEQFGAAKSLMLRVITGLVIIAISFVLVWTVVEAFS